MKTKRNTYQETGGFSLVEMLVVIAVIGIMAAIAIPAMSNTNGTAMEGAAKRNAQSLCSLHSSARSVGATFSSTTKEGIVDEMIVGKSGVDIGGTTFKMSPLGAAEKTAALAYCTYNSETQSLTYHEDGVLEEEAPIENEGWGEWQTFDSVADDQVAQRLSMYRERYPELQFQALASHGGYTPLQYRAPSNWY